VQAPSFCEQALQHFTQPCRTGPDGDDSTSLSSPRYPCTAPDSEAILELLGNLTAYNIVLPPEGFNCSCICDEGAIQRLGTVSVLMRAADTGRNYKELSSECDSGSTFALLDGIYQRPCASLSASAVAVRTLLLAVQKCSTAYNHHSIAPVDACLSSLHHVFEQFSRWHLKHSLRQHWFLRLPLSCLSTTGF
jgi:hypothetical protein